VENETEIWDKEKGGWEEGMRKFALMAKGLDAPGLKLFDRVCDTAREKYFAHKCKKVTVLSVIFICNEQGLKF